MAEEGGTPLTGDTFRPADFAAAKAEQVVLAPQRSTQWKAPHFVWQVRRELTTRLCGDGAETCPLLERGGLDITSTLDMRLQGLAEKWVKAATIVPQGEEPQGGRQGARAHLRALDGEPARPRTLRNGALVAMDYQTGELVAYAGLRRPDRDQGDQEVPAPVRRPRRRLAPARLGVQADRLRDRHRRPARSPRPRCSWTSSPTSAAATRRPTPTTSSAARSASATRSGSRSTSRRSRRWRSSATTTVQATAEAMGVAFRDGQVDAGLAFALGVEEVHPMDLVRAYGTLANGGKLVDQTTILHGDRRRRRRGPRRRARAPRPSQAHRRRRGLHRHRHPRRQHGPQAEPVLGQVQDHRGQPAPPGDAQDRHQQRRPRPQRLRLHRRADQGRAGRRRVRARGRRLERQLRQLAREHAVSDPLFSIDVTTYVWQGFLQEATEGWSINGFKLPGRPHQGGGRPVDRASRPRAARASTSCFLPGTAAHGRRCRRTSAAARRSSRRPASRAEHDTWMKANRGWLARAEKGAGRPGRPARAPGPPTSTTAASHPYGKSWGPLVGSGGGCASPSPSASVDPCASFDPLASVDPNASRRPERVAGRLPVAVRVRVRRSRPWSRRRPTSRPTRRRRRPSRPRRRRPPDRAADAGAHRRRRRPRPTDPPTPTAAPS